MTEEIARAARWCGSVVAGAVMELSLRDWVAD